MQVIIFPRVLTTISGKWDECIPTTYLMNYFIVPSNMFTTYF